MTSFHMDHTGASRSVGVRRRCKKYMFGDGTIVIAKSVPGARRVVNRLNETPRLLGAANYGTAVGDVMLPGPSGPSLLDISGMLYNEVRWAAPTPANGGVGFSLDFYGNNSAAPAYAETDEAVDVFSNKTQFSVSVWISPRSLFPDYFYQDNAGIWQVYMDHDHKLHCLFKSNKNVHVQFDNIGHEFVANLVSDQPNHIVLVYDGAQTNEEDRVKMYRDATALTRSDVHYGLWPAQTGPIVGPLRFGNDFYAPSERQFWGLVDDFRIYNYALSPSEVTGIFLSEDDPTANSGLVVWLPFDEGTGSNFQTANI